jgi:hypothetical protein
MLSYGTTDVVCHSKQKSKEGSSGGPQMKPSAPRPLFTILASDFFHILVFEFFNILVSAFISLASGNDSSFFISISPGF